MQIEAAALTVDVEYFPCQIQIFCKTAFKMLVRFGKGHAPFRDLRVIEAEAARGLQGEIFNKLRSLLHIPCRAAHNRSADLIVYDAE